MNGFVLAGGQSLRMGHDKALLQFEREPLILRALESLRQLNLRPSICGSRPDLARFAPVIPDNFAGCGPLAGIQAALSASSTALNLFIPVDTPNLPVEFLRWMMARAEATEALATIPYLGGRPQPLCAVYSSRLAPGLRSALQAGNCKVMTAIAAATLSLAEPIDAFQVESVASALPSGLWPATRPLRLWFRNLNTPADLADVSAPGATGRNPIS